MSGASGPLKGLRIVEFGAIGPVPFCGMLLSDLGADVVRIDRPDAPPKDRFTIEARGRRSVALDLKSDAGREAALGLIGAVADGRYFAGVTRKIVPLASSPTSKEPSGATARP